eukprot:g15493.t1
MTATCYRESGANAFKLQRADVHRDQPPRGADAAGRSRWICAKLSDAPSCNCDRRTNIGVAPCPDRSMATSGTPSLGLNVGAYHGGATSSTSAQPHQGQHLISMNPANAKRVTIQPAPAASYEHRSPAHIVYPGQSPSTLHHGSNSSGSDPTSRSTGSNNKFAAYGVGGGSNNGMTNNGEPFDLAVDILKTLPVINDRVADPSEIPTEKHSADGRIERIYRDGRREILAATRDVRSAKRNTSCIRYNLYYVARFTNGLKKILWPDSRCTVLFTNGDTKQCLADGTVVYNYNETSATQTTFPTGMEIFQFASGQVERHFSNGEKEIKFANGTLKKITADGKEEIKFPDGVVKHVDGRKNKS